MGVRCLWVAKAMTAETRAAVGLSARAQTAFWVPAVRRSSVLPIRPLSSTPAENWQSGLRLEGIMITLKEARHIYAASASERQCSHTQSRH